ncbi:MAG: right-handed parallel beta-helix repeat-containing protein [Myxococcales bacterium]|nr:right-handed parallel beta-helix repeat-containing protein [Myxococcales bacterium]
MEERYRARASTWHRSVAYVLFVLLGAAPTWAQVLVYEGRLTDDMGEVAVESAEFDFLTAEDAVIGSRVVARVVELGGGRFGAEIDVEPLGPDVDGAHALRPIINGVPFEVQLIGAVPRALVCDRLASTARLAPEATIDAVGGVEAPHVTLRDEAERSDDCQPGEMRFGDDTFWGCTSQGWQRLSPGPGDQTIHEDRTYRVAAGAAGDADTYPTIDAAMAALRRWRIGPGATVTVEVVGDHVHRAPVSLNHADGARLRVVGRAAEGPGRATLLCNEGCFRLDRGVTLGLLAGFEMRGECAMSSGDDAFDPSTCDAPAVAIRDGATAYVGALEAEFFGVGVEVSDGARVARPEALTEQPRNASHELAALLPSIALRNNNTGLLVARSAIVRLPGLVSSNRHSGVHAEDGALVDVSGGAFTDNGDAGVGAFEGASVFASGSVFARNGHREMQYREYRGAVVAHRGAYVRATSATFEDSNSKTAWARSGGVIYLDIQPAECCSPAISSLWSDGGLVVH